MTEIYYIYIYIKTGDFRKEREDKSCKSCPLKTGFKTRELEHKILLTVKT